MLLSPHDFVTQPASLSKHKVAPNTLVRCRLHGDAVNFLMFSSFVNVQTVEIVKNGRTKSTSHKRGRSKADLVSSENPVRKQCNLCQRRPQNSGSQCQVRISLGKAVRTPQVTPTSMSAKQARNHSEAKTVSLPDSSKGAPEPARDTPKGTASKTLSEHCKLPVSFAEAVVACSPHSIHYKLVEPSH